MVVSHIFCPFNEKNTENLCISRFFGVFLARAEGLTRLRCPKFACPPFRPANFDRGTRFWLAFSAFRGAHQRAPRHAVLETAQPNFKTLINKRFFEIHLV